MLSSADVRTALLIGVEGVLYSIGVGCHLWRAQLARFHADSDQLSLRCRAACRRNRERQFSEKDATAQQPQSRPADRYAPRAGRGDARHHVMEELEVSEGAQIRYCLSDIVVPDHLVTSPSIPIGAYRDGFGNWCSRIVAPTGRTRLSANGIVNDTARRMWSP
jgi:hypothetical protein